MVIEATSKQCEALADFGEVVEARLDDIRRLKAICDGVDTVVHLAADPSTSATWDSLRDNNIAGTYNLMVAAKAAGCRRVIFASSVNTVCGSPEDRQQHSGEPVAPSNLYGVSKCFGEALARYMAIREDLSSIVVRIGNFMAAEWLNSKGRHTVDLWVSPRDLMQLFGLCVENKTLQFGIFHGISNNAYKRLDISDAREILGYAPEDDAFKEIGELILDDVSIRGENLPRPIKPERSGLRDQLDELGQA